jgi:hypothetical protein
MLFSIVFPVNAEFLSKATAKEYGQFLSSASNNVED